MSEPEGLRIARESHILAKCFQDQGFSKDTSWELGFHLAEIRKELSQVAALLEKAACRGRISKKEYATLESNLFIHWPFHLKSVFAEQAKHMKRTAGWCFEDGFEELKLKKWAKRSVKIGLSRKRKKRDVAKTRAANK
jgi:hypothetical protein